MQATTGHSMHINAIAHRKTNMNFERFSCPYECNCGVYLLRKTLKISVNISRKSYSNWCQFKATPIYLNSWLTIIWQKSLIANTIYSCAFKISMVSMESECNDLNEKKISICYIHWDYSIYSLHKAMSSWLGHGMQHRITLRVALRVRLAFCSTMHSAAWLYVCDLEREWVRERDMERKRAFFYTMEEKNLFSFVRAHLLSYSIISLSSSLSRRFYLIRMHSSCNVL